MSNIQQLLTKTVASFVLLTSTIVSGQNISLMGTVDCGMWLDARNKKIATALESYSVGYVNGLAVGSSIDIWTAKGASVSSAQLHFWMDEYCKKNPLSGIFQGGHIFADEMTSGRFSQALKK
jgi:hypothetical protein